MPVENGEGVLSSLPDATKPPPVKWPHVKITNSTMVGRRTKIELDGKDISSWVFGYELSADMQSANTLRLDLYVGSVEVEQPVTVELDLDRTLRAALVADGWTPPQPPPAGWGD